MFRRKEEFEASNEPSAQGSLLGDVSQAQTTNAGEGVKVISPEKAAIAQKKPATARPASSSSNTTPSSARGGSTMSTPYNSNQSSNVTPVTRPSAEPARPNTATSGFRQPVGAESSRPRPVEPRSGSATPAARGASESKQRILTVGTDILLKGEITTCDRLVIEGKVDATLKDVNTLELIQGGSFNGNAKVEQAEISGAFEGDLEVTGRLIVYSTGKINGKIAYGEIEVERGGEVIGEIRTVGANAPAKKKEAA